MEPAVLLVLKQCGNGGAAVKAGNHSSQKSAQGGGAASVANESSSAPAEINRYDYKDDDGELTVYTTRVDGREVRFNVASDDFTTLFADTADTVIPRSVSFSVDGAFSISNEQGSSSTGRKIVSTVSRLMRQDASTRPDGFLYITNATTSDSRAATRTALYGRAGFSVPAKPGDTQYAVVRNGKMIPADSAGKPLSAKQQAQQRTRMRELLRQGTRDRREAQGRGVA